MEFDGRLGPGGRAILEELASPADDAALSALIVEAARHKDRLDRLNRLLAGDADTWLTLAPSRGDSEVLELKIDSAAAEARQLATVFRQTLVEIERRRGAGDDDGEVDALADL